MLKINTFILTTLLSILYFNANASYIPSETQKSNGELTLVVSINWEGRQIEAFNLESLTNLRSEIDHPFIHFINPAYFVRIPEQRHEILSQIKSQIAPGDQVGLLLSPWKSLVQKIGIPFKNKPTFWGTQLTEVDCLKSCGFDVPIHLYSNIEIEKLLMFSRNQLIENGFGKPKALRVQGWLADSQILDLAVKNGITHSFSGINLSDVKSRIDRFPIFWWAQSLWSHIDLFSAPYSEQLDNGTILQIPENLAPIDYHGLTHIKDQIDQVLANESHKKWIQITFSLETAHQNLRNISQAIQYAKDEALKKNIFVRSLPKMSKDSHLPTEEPSQSKLLVH